MVGNLFGLQKIHEYTLDLSYSALENNTEKKWIRKLLASERTAISYSCQFPEKSLSHYVMFHQHYYVAE